MKELDELLKHHGVLGMKWGVRNDRKGPGQNGNKNPSALKTRVKEELSSLSRERQWKKVLKNVNSLTTKEINTSHRRIQMENDLKRLSSNKTISSKKDKQDYRRRGNMSNQELSRKVGRLRAKESLHRTVNDASKGQREFGKKVIRVAGPLAVQYALTRSVGVKDVFSAVTNPAQANTKAAQGIYNEVKRRRQGGE